MYESTRTFRSRDQFLLLHHRVAYRHLIRVDAEFELPPSVLIERDSQREREREPGRWPSRPADRRRGTPASHCTARTSSFSDSESDKGAFLCE